MRTAKIRLYVDQPLGQGQSVALDRDQAHYLFGVMRQGAGDAVLVFNGQEGEWRAQVAAAGKRTGTLVLQEQTRPQHTPPDLWLVFAPIKKARTDFIVEKATEMGAARIVPIQTEFTNADRIRRDRLQAHAVEAAEQCGGTFVPQVAELQKFDPLLTAWPQERQIMFCDEALAKHSSALTGLFGDPHKGVPPAPWAIFIGPEGGFSPAERTRLAALPYAHATRLGPRILRADTAAVAALTLWQQTLGDWS